MSVKEINTGIHTYSVHKTLTAEQYHYIKKGKLTSHSKALDYFSQSERLSSDELSAYGIKLYLSRNGTIYSVKIRIEPCLVLGSNNPTDLYQPTKKSYGKIVEIADDLLEPFNLPCSITEMKICRIDATADLHFNKKEYVMDYIHVLKKSVVLPHYTVDYFRDSEKKAKDCKEANSHSFKQYCKSSSFFAYDKIAQLQMTKRLSGTLMGKNVLRLEAEMKRAAFKKRIGNCDSNYEYLKAGAKKAKHILGWYLKRLQPVQGDYLRYEDAVCMTENNQKGKKNRERMLYLLRKTSDSKSLSAALEKTKAKYGLTAGQINRLLKKFDKLGVSPITLPNSREMEKLESLRELLW